MYSDLPQKWGVWFAVSGDARFCSHRDMMRAIQRGCVRAGLGLSYSHGFNPHPKLALPCPRPVGAAAPDELLVLTMATPADADAARLVDRLNDHAPPGVRFARARVLPMGPALQPQAADYELPLAPDQVRSVARAVDQLGRADTWPVERPVKSRRAGRGERARRILDLKPMVTGLRVDGGRLVFRLHPYQQRWARPGEVLAIAGLPAGAAAGLVRTTVAYDL